jgi:DNA gyrase/topoisomerase IV subunit A
LIPLKFPKFYIHLTLYDIVQDSVDFKATYDDQDEEPIVLPAGFPNLLANGSSGIAVGMATSIPPHNAGELCAAALELVRDPVFRGYGFCGGFWSKPCTTPTGSDAVIFRHLVPPPHPTAKARKPAPFAGAGFV